MSWPSKILWGGHIWARLASGLTAVTVNPRVPDQSLWNGVAKSSLQAFLLQYLQIGVPGAVREMRDA